MPHLVTLTFICVGLSSVLGTLGSLALYHRWRGDRPGELLHLASSMSGAVSVAVFFAHLVLNGQWGGVWWTVIVLTLATTVLVAGRFYGQDGGSHPEHGPPQRRNPGN